MLKGIDIASWQEGISPGKLDIDFCIVKATEGIGYTNPYCDKWIQDCNSAGKLWGFYHFARENEPEEEAEYFFKECENYFGYGIPVLDYEVENYSNKEWCERFLKRLHELSGVWAIIYISAYRCKQYDGSWMPEKCGLWIAGYPHETSEWTSDEMPYDTSPWDFAAIWQFTSSLILYGYVGKLDGNYAYMDSEAWGKYANAKQGGSQKPTKSVDDLACEVVLGEYGTGEGRKRMLGARYNEVQARVNKYYEIADEVIEGKWGNGWNREQALTGAGYPYFIIQKIVNQILDDM